MTTNEKTKKIQLSASQIILFKSCPRSWYWKYVMKVKEPYMPWLNTGLAFHLCIEHTYMKIRGDEIKKPKYFDEDLIDLVNIGFDKGILEVPNNFLLEHNIKVPLCEGAYLKGIIDFVNVDDGKIEDHKTVSSWKYAETEETLKNNMQLLIYAKWYLNKVKTRKSVYLKHNQFHKNAPETSKSVEVKVSRDYVENYWEKEVMSYVNQMIEMKTNTDEKAFDFNLDSCGNYGGCSFLDKCSDGVKKEK
jgi:hypothetical protein